MESFGFKIFSKTSLTFVALSTYSCPGPNVNLHHPIARLLSQLCSLWCIINKYLNHITSQGEYTREARWRKILSPLKAREREIPRDRTETPEEALYDTLLSFLTSSGSANVSGEVLHEAFCRDMEAFSDVFLEDFVPLTTTTTTTSTTTRPTSTTDFSRGSRGEEMRGKEDKLGHKMVGIYSVVRLPARGGRG